MSKFKLRASLLLDSLLGLLIIGLITLILIPTLSTMNNNYNNNLKTIEIKKSIITSLYKYSKEQLKQGVVMDQYEIQLYQKKICGKDRDFNIKICVSFEN